MNQSPTPDELLVKVFDQVNQDHFDGFLDRPDLRWNARLRSSAGRFIPKARFFKKPIIEVASYLLEEAEADRYIWETVSHEMIHYWLWERGRPYGHTSEFLKKMKEIGTTRYNPVPRRRPYRYLYECVNCGQGYPARNRIRSNRACRICCQQFNEGKYHSSYQVVFVSEMPSEE